MEYKRNYFYLMGMKASRYAELPTIKMKGYKASCEITDIRYLNELAITVLEIIIRHAATEKNCDHVSLNMTGIEQNKIDLIEDIIGGINIKATKRGVGSGKTSITGSSERTVNESDDEEKGHITETFTINSRASNAIYKYAQEHNEINYFDLMCYIGAQMFEETRG